MLEIGLIFGLIAVNGVLAMSEMAMVSARRSRLQHMAEKGSPGAARALEFAEQPTRLLSTIQIGITAIGILSGALGEAALSSIVEVYIRSIPELAPYAHEITLTVVVLGITYFSLVIGELVPKRLALQHAEQIAVTMARPMYLLSLLTLPLVKVLSFSTDIILVILRVQRQRSHSITEEEIKVILDQATQEGVFEETEQELVENILRLDSRKVGSIMTPRQDMVFLDINRGDDQNRIILQEHPHWIIPLCDDGLDNVLGFVRTKDLLNRLLQGERPTLSALVTPALFVPNSVSLMQLLEHFKRSHLQTALVVDEYGELNGLVTLNDVLEAIVGDIASEGLDGDPSAVQRADGSWLVDATMDIDSFKELFDLEQLTGEDNGEFHTLAGFIMLQLGNIPRITDGFDYDDLHIEVIDMDRNRIDKVLVTRRTENAGG